MNIYRNKTKYFFKIQIQTVNDNMKNINGKSILSFKKEKPNYIKFCLLITVLLFLLFKKKEKKNS